MKKKDDKSNGSLWGFSQTVRVATTTMVGVAQLRPIPAVFVYDDVPLMLLDDDVLWEEMGDQGSRSGEQ